LNGWSGWARAVKGDANLGEGLGQEEAAPAQASEASFERELKDEKGGEQGDAERCVEMGFEVSAQWFDLCLGPTLVLDPLLEVPEELQREDRKAGEDYQAEKQICTRGAGTRKMVQATKLLRTESSAGFTGESCRLGFMGTSLARCGNGAKIKAYESVLCCWIADDGDVSGGVSQGSI